MGVLKMLSYRQGTVEKIIEENENYAEILVRRQGLLSHAINYKLLTGSVTKGDKVLVNTTAKELKLGTGGYDFVISNLNNEKQELYGPGHIMKLRYTPLQFKVLSVEEEESPYHDVIKENTSLEGAIVIIGALHSMLAPVAFAVNGTNKKKLRLIYIMTDGASLPIMFSKSVRELLSKDLLQGTITAGNAFGGDLEAVNIYSALLAAKWVLNADCIMVCMGPGIVGTGTKWGYTGIEQGQIINAVASLGGTPVAIPRVSFGDPRLRHQGLSHHTVTALKNVALASAKIPFGILDDSKMNYILEQWTKNKIALHELIIKDVQDELTSLANSNLSIKTMNRGIKEEKDFFSCCLAAGVYARELINEKLIVNNLLPSDQKVMC
jgi:hypothetical protein